MLGFSALAEATIADMALSDNMGSEPIPVVSIDASKVPASRTVVFVGGVRVVAFGGGIRTVMFDQK